MKIKMEQTEKDENTCRLYKALEKNRKALQEFEKYFFEDAPPVIEQDKKKEKVS